MHAAPRRRGWGWGVGDAHTHTPGRQPCSPWLCWEGPPSGTAASTLGQSRLRGPEGVAGGRCSAGSACSQSGGWKDSLPLVRERPLGVRVRTGLKLILCTSLNSRQRKSPRTQLSAPATFPRMPCGAPERDSRGVARAPGCSEARPPQAQLPQERAPARNRPGRPQGNCVTRRLVHTRQGSTKEAPVVEGGWPRPLTLCIP